MSAVDKPSHDEKSVHEGSPDLRGKSTSPWAWIPTANFASGLPYVMVATLSTIVFKEMGVSNAAIGLWTSLLLTPYTFKPLWGPLIDRYWTKRNWILLTQFLIGASLLLVSLSLSFPTSPLSEAFGAVARAVGVQDLPQFFLFSLIVLLVVAVASATYDIACDGFYMLALRDGQQSYFVGIRSTFYRMAMIGAGGLLPIIAGSIQAATGPKAFDLKVIADPEAAPYVEQAPSWVTGQAPAATQAILVSTESVVAQTSDTVTLHVRLAAPPKDVPEIVVVTRLYDGPRGLKFTEGDRAVFTTENWDQPTTLTMTFDQKDVKKRAEWEVQMTGGRIRLSWMVVFGVAGAMFLGLFMLHVRTLPVPAADAVVLKDRPPFYQPLFWMGLSVLVPILVVNYSLDGWIKYVQPKLAEHIQPWLVETFRIESEGAIKKLMPFVLGTIRWAAVLGVIGVFLFLVTPIRRTAAGAYQYASRQSGIDFFDVFVTFFEKKKILTILAFILLFRLGEAQIVKMGPAFLLDSASAGGLALTSTQIGIVYQTIGILCLTIGGIIGGYLISTYGLKKVIWPLVACMHVPNVLYIYMAAAKPTSIFVIASCVGIEQLGYGIGFASFMMYLIYSAQGEFKTSHYALCTGFMALGMQIPMMLSGFLQEAMGYTAFFVLACLLVIPGVLVIPFLPMDDDFGKSKKNKAAA